MIAYDLQDKFEAITGVKCFFKKLHKGVMHLVSIHFKN
jgi:hypothetical protein